MNSPKTSAENKVRFDVLDGLRGLAAICVMLSHLPNFFSVPNFAKDAQYAVDFFFILSGFVVSYAYEERLRSGSISFLSYALRRIVRLYPLIVVGALLGGAIFFVARLISGGWSPVNLILGLVALPALESSGSIMPVNPPEWSLFFELVASFAFGAAARALSTKRLIGLVVITAAIMAGSTFAGEQSNAGATTHTFWWGFPRVTFCFFLGVLLQRIHVAAGLSLPRIPAWVLALTLIGTLLPGQFHGGKLYYLALIFAVYPLIIMAGARTARGSHLEAAAMNWSGQLSYPLYVLHYPIIVGVGCAAKGILKSAVHPGAPFALVSVLVAMVFSIISLKIYDEPFREWLSFVLFKRRSKGDKPLLQAELES